MSRKQSAAHGGTPPTSRGRAVRSSARVRAALAVGAGAAVAATGTLAAWTDTAEIGGVTIQTGSVNLQVDEGNGAANWRENITDSTVLDVSGMLPGQTVAGVLRVRNTGSAALTTSLNSTATSSGGSGGTLHSSLTVKVTSDTAVAGTGTSRTCAGAAVAGSGTTLTSRLLPAWSLESGASRTVCVQITLAPTAPSSLQGASTAATLTFDGTTG